jgi:tetratricopeptide (TPR) repeat protein
MPYEMANYVLFETGLRVVSRMGGDLPILKSLVAAGFPVIIEREDTLQDIGWVGHYLTVYGYDDSSGEFISNDTYHGEGTRYSYDFIRDSWRSFNYAFLVVYPPELEAELLRVLGPFADNDWSIRHALEIAQQETAVLSGLQAYYAWFNVGTSYVNLFDYGPASVAYDTAFSIYREILEDIPSPQRPWRMMWYQTGPYFAYYYTGRYQDVYTLADTTLNAMNTPILEESFYWRGLAREALGDFEGALSDLQTSVNLNPNFAPGWTELRRMTGG